MTYEEILSRFDGPRKPNGQGGFLVNCPAHQSKSKHSLSISPGNGSGPLFNDFGGCETEAILAAVGMTWKDVLPPKETDRRKPAPAAASRTPGKTTRFESRDASGNLLAIHVREDFTDGREKKMWWELPDGTPNLGGLKLKTLRLYGIDRLPANAKEVVLAEGEKKTDVLLQNEIAALGTVTGSSGTPGDDVLRPLLGRTVYLWPDNDPPGRKHMNKIGEALLRLGHSDVRIIDWKGAPEKGDAADLFALEGARDEFDALMEEALEFGSRSEPITAPAIATDPAPAEVPDLERFPLSDAGNAELLAALHGDNLRFDSNQNRRLTFGPHLWAEDKNGAWVRLAIKTARQRYLDAVNAPERKREGIARFALRAEDRNRITATLALAESLPPIADTGEGWDADPMLLGGPNGVTDLRTGKLRDGRREDKITKAVGVPFDADARWTRWERFLLEIFDGNKDLVDFVWRAVGYSITGSTREQVIFLLYGTGANGKTTLLNAIRRALGQYAHNAPFSTFEHDGRSSIPADVADLAGCRFITSSETGEASRLNEQRVKVLTGGDPVTARGFYKPFFTFTPTGKPWLSVNHRPRVTDDSHGFWRRVRLIPFLRQFKEDADRNLERILAEEAPGILNWAIRGALEWQARGLTPPAIVTDAVEDYRRESDPLGEFVAVRCIVDPKCAAPGAMLYREYQAWAKEAGLREREQLSNTSFGRRLGARFKKERRKGGVEYQGVGVLEGGK